MGAGYRCTGSGFGSNSQQVRLPMRVRSDALLFGDDPLPTLG